MFEHFPDGWAGRGLLLLRTAAGGVLLARCVAYLGSWPDLKPVEIALAMLALASGILLVVGLQTRLAAVLATGLSVWAIVSWLPGPTLPPFETKLTAALAGVITAAVICLGPGAFSLDARWFGRHEINIPRAPGQL